MQARCRLLTIFFLIPFGLGQAGCHSCDLVEAELRTRDQQLREARDEIQRLRGHNHALFHEISALRQGPFRMTPEQASQTYTVRQIVLGRQTGGYDQDGIPGDELLQVVIEPRDPEGHAIKAPGTVIVTALEINDQGTKKLLSTWEIPPEQLRKAWQSGLFGSGYYLKLPWKIWPTTEKLRVVVQFALADGRLFEVDRDVTVRLPPKGAPMGPAPMVPPDGEPVLPLPRKLDSEPGPVLGPQGNEPGPWKSTLRRTGLAEEAPVPLERAARLLAPVPLRTDLDD